ncbi:MAG: hypothetical protein OXU61_02105 [Gammaproteobacteria bacterium]|nr:hypothetical protein [Gammaproteobacteria bacterium]
MSSCRGGPAHMAAPFPRHSRASLPLEGEKRRLRFPCPLGGRRRRYAPHRRDFGLRPRLADSPSRGE